MRDPDTSPRREEYPALSMPRYEEFQSDYHWGELVHLHGAIEYDDVPAVLDFIRLEPDILRWEDSENRLSPPLVYAAELGSNAALTALLDYRDTLSPEARAPPSDLDCEEYADVLERLWGTPLTTACMCARVDTLRILLERMPDADINEYDRQRLTPLLAVAEHSHFAPLSGSNGGGYDGHRTVQEWMVRESNRRVELVRLMLAHGARPQAVKQGFLYLEDIMDEHEERGGQDEQEEEKATETTETKQDVDQLDDREKEEGEETECEEEEEEQAGMRAIDRPGGLGTALVLALARSGGSDMALVKALIEDAGIDVHRGYLQDTVCLDGTGDRGAVDDGPGEHRTIRNMPSWRKRRPCTFLTPLAAAAMYRNAAGVAALLQIPGADFTADLVAPVVALPPLGSGNAHADANSDGDANIDADPTLFKGIAAMRPLHAAMLGPPEELLWWPFYDRSRKSKFKGDTDYDYESPAHNTAEAVKAAREDKEDKENKEARKAAARGSAFVDDYVTTVRLLTADEAVCAATINATHKGGFTPLHFGARFDRLPAVRVLLNRGADPSIRMPGTGRSVLFLVFASLLRLCPPTAFRDIRGEDGGKGNLAEVRAIDASIGMDALVGDLLWAPKNPHARKGGELEDDDKQRAAAGRRLIIIDEADADGNTSLHWAAGFSLPHAQAALLAHGARADARNNSGEVPTEGKLPTTSREILQRSIFEY